jgi:hypothetical protein
MTNTEEKIPNTIRWDLDPWDKQKVKSLFKWTGVDQGVMLVKHAITKLYNEQAKAHNMFVSADQVEGTQ